ncbi:MAG: hypothetical protein O7B25_02420 [Gammaproteobacteria bacterium]|nr:hypothetical protein [Gammaproteobacteria bacterium]
MTTKTALLISVICMLSGCWNQGNTHISLGSVSIGQQMIDLKSALEAGAMSQTEYDQTRATLLSMNTVCDAALEED